MSNKKINTLRLLEAKLTESFRDELELNCGEVSKNHPLRIKLYKVRERLKKANLIAAAPDMYEALVALLTSTDLNLDEGIDETTIEAMRLGWDAVRKAGEK